MNIFIGCCLRNRTLQTCLFLSFSQRSSSCPVIFFLRDLAASIVSALVPKYIFLSSSFIYKVVSVSIKLQPPLGGWGWIYSYLSDSIPIRLASPSSLCSVRYRGSSHFVIHSAMLRSRFTSFPGFRHSYLSASTGFLVAALQLWKLTVSIEIASTMMPDKANIHHPGVVL